MTKRDSHAVLNRESKLFLRRCVESSTIIAQARPASIDCMDLPLERVKWQSMPREWLAARSQSVSRCLVVHQISDLLDASEVLRPLPGTWQTPTGIFHRYPWPC